MKGNQPDQESLFKAACLKEGILGKQARNVLGNYTKRFWVIEDKGLTLSYAPTKQDMKEGKLKGKIAIKDILSIVDEGKPKKFHLICDGRVYKLEAANVDEKKSWIEALNICMKHAVEQDQKEKNALLAIDDDIIFEEDHDDPDEKASGKLSGVFQPLGFIGMAAKTVAVDTVLNTGVKIFKTGINTVGNAIMGDRLANNDEFLTAKKLKESLDQIDPKILRSRILMGYMFKESREATGFGLVDDLVNDVGIRDTMAKQWFLLISAKPIVFDQIDPSDEEVLDAGKLPVEFDLETLYGFDHSCDDTGPLEVIPMNNVTDVIVKKKGTEDLLYRFVLNLGQKKVYLITESVFETTAWVKAIQASRAAVKEQTKSKWPFLRNIYWLRKIMDEQGEEKLIEKIEKDYEELIQKNEDNDLDGIQGLLKLQRIIGEDLASIINACLVNKDKRIDIIKTYISCYHENIVASLRNYFKKNKDEFSSQDCFEFIGFLIWYNKDVLQIFGSGFTDRRITDGIKTLCRIVSNRILRTNLDSVQNIIKEDAENQPSLDGKSLLRSNGPQDIFRIVNETFNILSHCNYKELAFALLSVAKTTLRNYQEGLHYIIEECKLSNDQLGAFCNNTMTYMIHTKEFIEKVEGFNLIDPTVLSEKFDEESVTKGFVDVSKKAYETIAEDKFCSLKEEWRNKPFLTIDLRISIDEKLQEVQIVTEKVHHSYINKIELSCLEKITAYYIQNFLKNCERKMFRKEDCTKILEKLDADHALLREIFTRTLKPTVVENVITPIRDFYGFLDINYSFLDQSVTKMKETYGSAIKWATFEMLVKIRNDELSPAESKQVLQSCEEAFHDTHVSRGRARATTYNVFKHVNQNFGSSEETEEEKNEDGPDEEMVQDDMRSSRGSMAQSQSMRLQQHEGYLEAQKDGLINVFNDSMSNSTAGIRFERLFFTIRRNIMYYYQSKSAETAIGSYKLREVSECAPFENDALGFFIKMKAKSGEMKRIVFKAENVERRGVWVSAINSAMNLDTDARIEILEGEAQFFKDTKAIFTEVDEPVNTKFEWKLPIAAEEEEEELPVERRSTIVFRRETRRFKEEEEEVKMGCMAKFCKIFGIGGKKKPSRSSSDYVNIQHNTSLML